MAIAKTDDLGRQLATSRGLDDHPAADPQFAHGTDHLDEQALHGLDPAEHFDLVNGVYGCTEGFHQLILAFESVEAR